MNNDKLQQIITETIQRQINEAIALNQETNNIQNITNALQNIYNRIIQKGASRNEMTVAKIAKMIQDLKIIQKHWQNITMW